MKKTLFVILAILSISAYTFGNEREKPSSGDMKTTTVAGKVVDKASGESLAGVTIKISSCNKVVYTDLEGNFKINDVTPGTYDLEAAFISYKQNNKKVKADLGSDNTVRLELENL